MLNIFRKRAPKGTSLPRQLPAGHRIYAIGDIHGRLDLLDDLITQIDADDARRPAACVELLFLGDLIDRGPDSAGVVDRVLKLSQSRGAVRLILGNHEEVFLLAHGGDLDAMRLFTRIGGRETLLSYGISEQRYEQSDYATLIELIQAAVPSSHIAFLEAAETVIEMGDYAFVHAGIRPGIALPQQRTSDLRWIRRTFLDSDHEHGRMVVHGHSIADDVEVRSNRIGIDTGAFDSGRLTALGLEGSERWFLATEPTQDDAARAASPRPRSRARSRTARSTA